MHKHHLLTLFVLLGTSCAVKPTSQQDWPPYASLLLEGKEKPVQQYFNDHERKIKELVSQVIQGCMQPSVDLSKALEKVDAAYFNDNILTNILAHKNLFEASRKDMSSPQTLPPRLQLESLTHSFVDSIQRYAKDQHDQVDSFTNSVDDDLLAERSQANERIFQKNYMLAQELYNGFADQQDATLGSNDGVRRGVQTGLGALIVAYLMSNWKLVRKIKRARKKEAEKSKQ